MTEPTLAEDSGERRIVLLHTAGPYPGLHQIVGLFTAEDGELGRIPDRLPAHPAPAVALWPDGRLATALRLKSTPRYVSYVERPVEGVQGAPAA